MTTRWRVRVRSILLLLIICTLVSSFLRFVDMSSTSIVDKNDAAMSLPAMVVNHVESSNNNNNNNNNSNNLTGPILRLIPESDYYRQNDQKQYYDCPITFYVYDDLPADLSTTLETIVMEGNHSTNENAETELALIRLFRTSPCRVHNITTTTTVDYYIVPYLHAAHCQSTIIPSRHQCDSLPSVPTSMRLLRKLKYFLTAPKRHVFILGWGTFMNLIPLENKHVTLSPGPKNAGRAGNNTIVIPILNDDSHCQPSALLQNQNNANRRRTQALTFIYGGINTNMRRKSGKRFRIYFANELRGSGDNATATTIGGMPYTMMASNSIDTQHVLSLYRNSILCPVLPGDTSWQRRFFDVIMSGCIPVVLEWTIPPHDERTWFVPTNMPGFHIYSIQQSYPFIKGEYFGHDDDDNFEIDYDEFVITIPGNPLNERHLSGLRTKLELILADTVDIQRRQRIMAEHVAIRMTYGLGADAHKYKDAFWGILKALSIDSQYERVEYNVAKWQHRMKNITNKNAIIMPKKTKKNVVWKRRRKSQ